MYFSYIIVLYSFADLQHESMRKDVTIPMDYELQKASMWKRISAFLFDFIMLGIVAVLIAWGLSALTGYDGYSRTVTDSYARYGEMYGVELRISQTEYQALPEEEARKVDAGYAALNEDQQAVRAFDMMLHLSVLIISLSFFFAYLIMEFFVPLKLGTGQTLGKKIFGIGLMKTEGVKVNGVTLFIRAILGKYAIETMVPALILLMIYWGTIGVVGPAVIFLILLTEIILVIATRTNSLIHDLLAGTVVIDAGSQRIFDTPEEMAAYKAKIAKELAQRQEY